MMFWDGGLMATVNGIEYRTKDEAAAACRDFVLAALQCLMDTREQAAALRESWTEADIPEEWREPSVESTPRQTIGLVTWPPKVKCCDEPANFKAFEREVCGLDIFECQVCGSQVGAQEFENLSQWASRKASLTEESEIDRATRQPPMSNQEAA